MFNSSRNDQEANPTNRNPSGETMNAFSHPLFVLRLASLATSGPQRTRVSGDRGFGQKKKRNSDRVLLATSGHTKRNAASPSPATAGRTTVCGLSMNRNPSWEHFLIHFWFLVQAWNCIHFSLQSWVHIVFTWMRSKGKKDGKIWHFTVFCSFLKIRNLSLKMMSFFSYLRLTNKMKFTYSIFGTNWNFSKNYYIK